MPGFAEVEAEGSEIFKFMLGYTEFEARLGQIVSKNIQTKHPKQQLYSLLKRVSINFKDYKK